jgi:diacylglycerol kinase family enzyme
LVVITSQVPLQQHLNDDRLLFLRCSRVTITPDAVNPIGYNVDGQSIPPVTLQITAGVEHVDFVTNTTAAPAK